MARDCMFVLLLIWTRNTTHSLLWMVALISVLFLFTMVFLSYHIKPPSNDILRKEGTYEHVTAQESTLRTPQTEGREVTISWRKASGAAPGELGRGIMLNISDLSEADTLRYKEGWKRHGFNQFVSDMISVQRSLQDVRDSRCEQIPHDGLVLEEVSVIVVFYNEALSTLLRTVYSVLHRTPPHLLREIILVDDFSNYEELQALPVFIKTHLTKVRLVRAPSRLGLIQARVYGVEQASANTYVFLDSHCECTQGWLPPLLAPLTRDPSHVTMPIINPVRDTTFQFLGPDSGYTSTNAPLGGFTWTLDFDWFYGAHCRLEDWPLGVPPNVRGNYTDISPVCSPTMAGGLFAIRAEFFRRLGYYDPDFRVWGSENLELSFKIWMCGGKLLQVPCSHVGHVFRGHTPYLKGKGNEQSRNKVRLAEVWMDQYKLYFFRLIQFDLGEYGNVTSRKALREKLQCRSFDWYLQNVYPQRHLPAQHLAFGGINNRKLRSLCLQAGFEGLHPEANRSSLRVTLVRCAYTPSNQMFAYCGEDRSIRCDHYCLALYKGGVRLLPDSRTENQHAWGYEQGQLVHSSGKCLDVDPSSKHLLLTDCHGNATQLWDWQNYGRHD